MRKCAIKLVLIGAASGLMFSALGGCAQKTASIDAAEQTAKTEDTAGSASPAAAQTAAEASKSTSGDSAALAANAGAGPSEPLDTPPANREGLAGRAGMTGVVEGSRTSMGLMPIYFDYDKSVIRPDQVEMVRANAEFLKGNPAVKARIEGNCDERGTYVYNLALGEYRAMGAKKYLINLGVDGAQLTTLSYGEEKPLNPGQDEVAWAENRRDDFVIVQ